MITFMDGPAAMQSLWLKRAPLFLRVVETPGGNFDALDRLHDTPASDERIHVYLREGEAQLCHIRATGRSGWYQMASYVLHADQPGEGVRDTEDWRRWVLAQGRPGDSQQKTDGVSHHS